EQGDPHLLHALADIVLVQLALAAQFLKDRLQAVGKTLEHTSTLRYTQKSGDFARSNLHIVARKWGYVKSRQGDRETRRRSVPLSPCLPSLPLRAGLVSLSGEGHAQLDAGALALGRADAALAADQTRALAHIQQPQRAARVIV